MDFSLPSFNLTVNMFMGAAVPDWATPDFENVPAQCYLGSRAYLDITPLDPTSWVPPIFWRVPVDNYSGLVMWIEEVTRTTYYKVRWCHIVHQGFANQYGMYLCEMVDVAGAASFAQI